VNALRGKRVLALVMHALVGDLDGIELVGEGADAVLIGGADETPETNLVFSYMNLARAFAELELGARLYCLHKNRWWQTARGPLLDAGAFVAGLEYAADVEAVVIGKPSPAYFAAALEALDTDPDRAWMVGDDLESDIAGAQAVGMKTVLVRTGKFRPDAVEASRVRPDGIVSSIVQLPDWIEEHL
jgi:HAD superfamily hydrolase (TIGR01458 family)